MTNTYCNVYNEYRKYTNPKISCIFKKTLGLSIVCSKCSHELIKKYFKKKNQLKY